MSTLSSTEKTVVLEPVDPQNNAASAAQFRKARGPPVKAESPHGGTIETVADAFVLNIPFRITAKNDVEGPAVVFVADADPLPLEDERFAARTSSAAISISSVVVLVTERRME